MSNYPEHDKLHAVKEKSQAIGEFLDWLEEGEYDPDIGPVSLAFRPFITERPVYAKDGLEIVDYESIPRDEWKRTSRLEFLAYDDQKLLAKYFGIDLRKLDDEKRAMLDECRKAHADKKKSVPVS